MRKAEKKITPETFIASIRNSFIGAEQVYMNGSCIMFYKVLKAVFADALPYWSAVDKHMITKIGHRYFDITGEVQPDDNYKLDDGEYSSYPIAVAFPQNKEQRKRYIKTGKLY